MELPANYYHCFLGNGLDAVLIGPTGAMVADKVGVDRCAWYKSDRYYPEHKLVMVSGRWPLGQKLEHAEGSGWYEVAPLGRTWYEVRLPDQPGDALALQASQQRFVPHEGTLYSTLDYGAAHAQAETWMHPRLSLLVMRFTFDREVDFRAWMGPGVWVEEGWDTDPFIQTAGRVDAPQFAYDLGETQGTMTLHLDLPTRRTGFQGGDRWIDVRGTQITQYFSIIDDRQGKVDLTEIEQAIGQGYDALRAELLMAWRDYFAASSIRIPDAQYQYFYEASMYHMKAMQNPVSGGLPVNNLRRTWSSHVFWDAYFLQRALLEANHRHEALESARFFQRTRAAAERHAREEFGCDGLKWDWEVTHDGRKAYGALLHQKFQIHNNGSHANQIWDYYAYTQDTDMLREFFPILEGLAQFYLHCVVQHSDRGYEIGYQVGVHEHPEKVRNDGINLAATGRILRLCADAARILGIESDFTRECATIADELLKTQYALYNGLFLRASEDQDMLNMSSLGPIYPMRVIDSADSRAVSTAWAFLERYEGRAIGHGGSESGFPWAAGVLGMIFALQGQGDTAWQIIQTSRGCICIHGGMTEVMENGQWNMQYFGTAQGAVCTAIHNLLLQAHGDEIRLFPALPKAWQTEPGVSFENLLAAGFLVSAQYNSGQVRCTLKNIAAQPLTRAVKWTGQPRTVTLQPGEETEITWVA